MARIQCTEHGDQEAETRCALCQTQKDAATAIAQEKQTASDILYLAERHGCLELAAEIRKQYLSTQKGDARREQVPTG